MLHREPVAIEDVLTDARVRHEGERTKSVRSLVVVPIGRREPFGAIGAYWAVPRRPIARELQLLQALADSVAIALERAQSFDSVESARVRAEASATAHQDLLAIVSHDLRNPLSVIANTAEIIAGTAIQDVGVADQVRCHVSTIRRVSSRMEKLIQDFLDLARMRAHALELHLELVDVRSMLEMAEDLRSLALQKGLELQLDRPREPIAVYADRERIGQVLVNLVGNAIKFTPPGGRVAVAAEWSNASHADEVAICVRDSGPGIPASDVERLFGQFTRGAARNGNGAGLGLWIAKGLVELHGGRIWAKNHDGGGATFTFTLPRTLRTNGSTPSEPFLPAGSSVTLPADQTADNDG